MWSRSLRVSPEKAQLVIEAFQRTAFSSQQGLATELGFSRSTVSNFFNGKAVDRLIFIEISEKLGLNWQTIVDIKATENKTSMPDCRLRERYPDLPVAVILTAIKEETTAVLHHLGGADQTENEEGYFCREFRENGQDWLVAVKEIGAYNDSQRTTNALNLRQPNVILLVGIAGTLKVKDADLGDVIAARMVRSYVQGRVEDGQIMNRSQFLGKASDKLIEQANQQIHRNTWIQRIEGGCPQIKPKAVIEVIVSGDMLFAGSNNDFFTYIKTNFSDAVAIEMEGYGFHKAVDDYHKISSNPRVEALVIRGISDSIDNQSNNQNSDRKVTAARHASAFAFEILANFKINNHAASRSNSDRPTPRVKQNLPRQDNECIGREDELKKLIEYLSFNERRYVIAVGGIGGVGKTALVLEAAYRCLKASEEAENVSGIQAFDAIIYTSAKERMLLPGEGIVYRQSRDQNLGDIFTAIARTLEDRTINEVTTEKEQIERVKKSLAKQRTLLIIDNLETIDDRKQVITFLHDNLPNTVKVIITTRDQEISTPINLETLLEPDRLDLIEQRIKFHNIQKISVLSSTDIEKLCKATYGIPLAIVYAVGLLSIQQPLSLVLDNLGSNKNELTSCLFEKAVEELKANNQFAYKLLISLAIFSKTPVREAVVKVAGLNTVLDRDVDKSLTRLQQLSFIKQNNNRYEMLSLTREYALAQLRDEINDDFCKEALERWVKYYLKFVKENGGEDWENWEVHYNSIEDEWENILAVLNWCSEQKGQKYYEYVREIWQEINRFANIYGYWPERILWLKWLEEKAKSINDLATVVYAMAKRGWTLTLKGIPQDLEKAEEIFKEALSLCDYAEKDDQIYLTNHMAVLCIRKEQLKPKEQQQYKEATDWLNEADKFLKELCENNPNMETQELTRRRIRIPYYQAQIKYYEGNYGEAKKLLDDVLNDAERSDWQRVVVDARNWLADVAIKQGDLVEAEKLLKAALTVADRNKNKRRVALCQRTYAYLEYARSEQERNSESIREWTNKALGGFDKLGMAREADEMQKLLDSLPSQEK
jgi:nucleoside phosphorylase